jgi:predicted nucleotidyltransferase
MATLRKSRTILRSMRKSALDALLPRSRRGILCALLGAPPAGLHLSEIARRMGVAPSSLQRELAALSTAEILTAERDGNRVRYAFNEACPFMPELRGLLVKTAGVADVLREALEALAERIEVAFVFGSIARGTERADSDVDLMVVGSASPYEVSVALADAAIQLGREVNPVVYTSDEFVRRVGEKRAFPRDPLEREKVFVLGTAHGLAELARKADRGRATSRSGGDR